MMTLSLSLVAIAAFWAFIEWPLGLILCLVTAIAQDPLRKLTPNQPVIFVIFVAVVFGAAYLGAYMQGVPLTPSSTFRRERQLATTMRLLIAVITLEAVNSFIHFGNPLITLTGLLTYLLPLPSIAFAYQIVVRGDETRIHQFMTAYVILIMLALTTVYLEYAGYAWPVFGQVGQNLVLYDKFAGGVIVPHSGIFRASEIAAWHAATCACFVLLLATLRKFSFMNLLLAAIVVALLMGIAVLTGRRKAVVEVAVFASTYFTLWIVFEKAVAKLGVALAFAGIVVFGVTVAKLNDAPAFIDQDTFGYYRYVERSKTVFEAVPARFTELGIAPITWAYNEFGIFGAGLGVGTQGTQHFGGGGAISGAAEGGLGKITLELGIPGLVLMGWFAILVFNYLWRIMRDASLISTSTARLCYGFFSFLVANIAAFSVATQAYGDIFILLVLTWTLGFFLAVPALLERKLRSRRPELVQQSAPLLGPKAA